MALKKYAKQEDIPEHLREDYQQVGSEWVPDLGDAPPPTDSAAKKKEAEWRAIAQKQREQLEAVQAKLAAFGDLDPETIGKALDALSKTQNDEEAQLVRSGRLDEVVNRRTKVLQDQAKKQAEELTKKLEVEARTRTEAVARYSSLAIQNEVQKAIAAKKLQPKPTAIEDINMRASRAWKIGDDLTLQANFALPTGDEPTMDRFVDGLLESAPHLFADSEGGGVKPGGPRGGGVTRVKAGSLSSTDFASLAPQIAAGKVVIE